MVENTFQAFNKATQLLMDFIELDVQLSQDKVLYILHDARLDRTMNASGELSQWNSQELDKIRSKDGKWPIPRLSTLFDKFEHKSVLFPNLMIELKRKGTGIQTAKMIKEKKLSSKIVFSGRSLPELQDAHLICPDVPICLNITKCKEFPLDQLYNINSQKHLPLPFKMISLKSQLIDSEKFINKCHSLQIQALSWNFIDYSNPIEVMKQLMKWKIDGILFDDPKTVMPIRSLEDQERSKS
ncbi:glycerophosphodiester phosphodiesterase [Candidatus Harpocratesius sp.]